MYSKHKIISLFWRGLLTLLPFYLTLYFIFWLLQSIEAISSQVLQKILGTYYIPGMGLLTALLIVFLTGLLLQTYITRHMAFVVQRFMSRLPIIGDVYQAIQTFIKYLTSPTKPDGEDVVMVHFKALNIKVLGIVTRTSFDKAPAGIGDDTLISVYLPMSYQIGGYTVYVPKDAVTKVELSQKEAMKWAFMGGIGQ
ncbi:DUF502 domain-containing protein [Legionella sp. 27cVA30]|uniref:DUF502 domain-containing protein n=1 Tax=Legionella sp. 27cVA30 TaxID=2905657 RepID=UPI00209DA0BE|nr:DUF502 domain-containing protein [Legionella sp. 27cVA30]MCP0913215.1 DUF502 domain-containing protein [Legionella sp. 27cVA30]